VVYFGVISSVDGCLFCCDQSCVGIPTPTPFFDTQQRRIYESRNGQFVIVVEGVTGDSGQPAGTSLDGIPPDDRPDIWIESTSNQGDGSLAVCDTGPPPPQGNGGGVPGVPTPDFSDDGDADQTFITDALNDFACRFDPFVAANSPCTIKDPSREPKLIVPTATVQFCDFVASTAIFPPGDSILTVKLRDTVGNLGPTAQIVVRVATPTPPH